MNREDIELVRHYLINQNKDIEGAINSVNALKEALIELLPEFQESYRAKYEGLLQRSIEAATSSEFSGPSAVNEILRILQELD